MVPSLKDIPKFISASSPQGLQRKMYKNNVDRQKVFRYFDLQETREGRWIAWYYDAMSIEDELREIENGDRS